MKTMILIMAGGIGPTLVVAPSSCSQKMLRVTSKIDVLNVQKMPKAGAYQQDLFADI